METLREKIAKWLFKNRDRLPNKRFYANWHDEIAALPLTEAEYIALADQILALFREAIEKLKPLSDEKMGQVKFDMGSPWGLADRHTVGRSIAQAQLDDIKRQLKEMMK